MSRYYIDHEPAFATPAVLNRPDLACQTADVDPEWFYPGPGRGFDKAIAVCKQCPAITDCGNWAITTGQQFGVWGATTPEYRDRILNRTRRSAA